MRHVSRSCSRPSIRSFSASAGYCLFFSNLIGSSIHRRYFFLVFFRWVLSIIPLHAFNNPVLSPTDSSCPFSIHSNSIFGHFHIISGGLHSIDGSRYLLAFDTVHSLSIQRPKLGFGLILVVNLVLTNWRLARGFFWSFSKPISSYIVSIIQLNVFLLSLLHLLFTSTGFYFEIIFYLGRFFIIHNGSFPTPFLVPFHQFYNQFLGPFQWFDSILVTRISMAVEIETPIPILLIIRQILGSFFNGWFKLVLWLSNCR